MSKMRELRLKSGLKAKVIAERLGICRRTFYCYEKGEYPIPFEVCVKLAKMYGVSILEFVEEEESENGAKAAGNVAN